MEAMRSQRIPTVSRNAAELMERGAHSRNKDDKDTPNIGLAEI